MAVFLTLFDLRSTTTRDLRVCILNWRRWCNQHGFFKKMSFRQYCVRNEEYHQGIQDLTPKGNYNRVLKIPRGVLPKEKYCSCYQTMLDFEAEFPEIAKKYFDLRFEELNQFQVV